MSLNHRAAARAWTVGIAVLALAGPFAATPPASAVTFPSDSSQQFQLSVNGRCAEDFYDASIRGTWFKLQTCNASTTAQLWTHTSSGQLKNVASGLCAQAQETDDAPILGEPCSESEVYQQWPTNSTVRIRRGEYGACWTQGYAQRQHFVKLAECFPKDLSTSEMAKVQHWSVIPKKS